MPDNIPPSTGAAPGGNPPKPRGPFNKAQLTSISRTEQICAIALKPDFLPALENNLPLDEGGITKAWIQDLAAQCTTARTTSAQAVDATTGKEDDTVQEHGDAAALIALLRYVQSRARQKYAGKKGHSLADYGIGSDMLVSRAILEGWGQAIYDKTDTETLPGVDATKRAEIQSALTKYKGTQTEQTTSQGTATRLRSTRDTFIEDIIIAGRMKIQFAADALWPWTDEANHATRVEFQLPASRPFSG